MTEEQEKKFKENFYKPSTKRDPNAGFIVTGISGFTKVKSGKKVKPDKENSEKKD